MEDPARRLLEAGFGERRIPERIPPRPLEWGLGRGGSEVLALAFEERSARAVLEDAAARRCAAALGVSVIGTLGIVARAKRMGRIESAGMVFRSLLNEGFRIDQKALQTVAEELGEAW